MAPKLDLFPKIECPRCKKLLLEQDYESHANSHSSQILPYLFLGNMQSAYNKKELTVRTSITDIMNMAGEVENKFMTCRVGCPCEGGGIDCNGRKHNSSNSSVSTSSSTRSLLSNDSSRDVSTTRTRAGSVEDVDGVSIGAGRGSTDQASKPADNNNDDDDDNNNNTDKAQTTLPQRLTCKDERISSSIDQASDADSNELEPLFHYHTFGVADAADTNLLTLFDTTYREIEEVRQRDGRILVHCIQGISRSVSVVIAYLMRSQAWSLRKAYNHVKAIRTIAKPIVAFVEQLQNFERLLGQSMELDGYDGSQPSIRVDEIHDATAMVINSSSK
jgi:protein-tyrosine phosphatase